MWVIVIVIGLNVRNVFVSGRPDKGERTRERFPEINRREGKTHRWLVLLNTVSDGCNNASGCGARIRIHIHVCSEDYKLKYKITE